MTKYQLPENWRDSACYVVSINASLLPIVAGQLRLLEARGSWIDSANYERGYNAIAELEACLMATCLNDMLDLQRATYRMLDTGLFGTEYTVESTDPLVVTPEIPPQRTIGIYNQDSALGRLDRITKLIDNAVNGTTNDLYTFSPSVKALLQSIIDALSADNTDLSDILTQLETIAALVA